MNARRSRSGPAILATMALALLTPCLVQAGGTIPPSAATELAAGRPVRLIVEYDAATVDLEAAALRSTLGAAYDDDRIQALRSTRYATLKRLVHAAVSSDSDLAVDYSHLPMSTRTFRTLAGLRALVAQPTVKSVFEVRNYRHALVHSLPLIGQPTALASGYAGAGVTVAVLDDGINVANSAFAPCSAPDVPSGCPVAVSLNFGSGTTNNDHGTNVSAIVLGIAPKARVAALNVFSGTSANSADIVSALNWVIANRSVYNIVAANMSLGDSTANTSPCGNALVNPFVTPFASVHAAGVAVVVAAGNNMYTNALSNPACTPLAISVGAVYSTNWGSAGFGVCTDATSATDQVPCFSNSASFLSILAPGAIITAGGIAEAGTSQATPHVAGALAVMRAAVLADSPDQALARLTASGKPVTDARNGITKPRLDLAAATAALTPAASGDIPALPVWGAALLVGLLAVAVRHAHR
jgi:subtilisin family serine protease